MRLIAEECRNRSSVHSPLAPSRDDLLPIGRLKSLLLGQPFFVLFNVLKSYLKNGLTKPVSQGKKYDHIRKRKDKPANEGAPAPRQVKQQGHGKQKKSAIHQDACNGQNQHNTRQKNEPDKVARGLFGFPRQQSRLQL